MYNVLQEYRKKRELYLEHEKLLTILVGVSHNYFISMIVVEKLAEKCSKFNYKNK